MNIKILFIIFTATLPSIELLGIRSAGGRRGGGQQSFAGRGAGMGQQRSARPGGKRKPQYGQYGRQRYGSQRPGIQGPGFQGYPGYQGYQGFRPAARPQGPYGQQQPQRQPQKISPTRPVRPSQRPTRPQQPLQKRPQTKPATRPARPGQRPQLTPAQMKTVQQKLNPDKPLRTDTNRTPQRLAQQKQFMQRKFDKSHNWYDLYRNNFPLFTSLFPQAYQIAYGYYPPIYYDYFDETGDYPEQDPDYADYATGVIPIDFNPPPPPPAYFPEQPYMPPPYMQPPAYAEPAYGPQGTDNQTPMGPTEYLPEETEYAPQPTYPQQPQYAVQYPLQPGAYPQGYPMQPYPPQAGYPPQGGYFPAGYPQQPMYGPPQQMGYSQESQVTAPLASWPLHRSYNVPLSANAISKLASIRAAQAELE